MRRILLKTISLKLVILFGAVFILNTETAEANGTAYKEMVSTIVYESYVDGGFEIFGIDMPFGFSVEVGINAIGTNLNCEWAWSDCVGTIGYVPFPK